MKGITIIKSVEEFANMQSAEISKLIRENPGYYIVGYVSGRDRHIIQADNHNTYMNYYRRCHKLQKAS